MSYLFRIFFFLIDIDQETVLRWFGLSNLEDDQFLYDTNSSFSILGDEPSTNLSIETVRLIVEGLWNKLQSGLNLDEIESLLLFILFVRFVILAIKYNLKTSFYITCITFAAGFLWYRHLIDVMLFYRNILLGIPFFHKLGMDALELRILVRQNVRNDMILGENVHWYDFGKLIYYAFTKGIVDVDPVTGLKSYIDPISMLVANLEEPLKSNVIPYYYKVYNNFIPKIFRIATKFGLQMMGLVSYVLITRVGKRYCPYLVRWYWTLMLILNFPEQIVTYLVNRMVYFQSFVLLPQLLDQMDYELVDESLLLQFNILNGLLTWITILHMSFVILVLLHAVCGQYFYVIFFVENAELHIGPRPKNSVYSGGYTSWQDPEEKEKRMKNIFPSLWYGWLGKRRNTSWQPIRFITNYTKTIISRIAKNFRK